MERLRVKFEVAIRPLQSNYELTAADLAELLVLEPDDPASEARWEEITNVLIGNAPKPSPVI